MWWIVWYLICTLILIALSFVFGVWFGVQLTIQTKEDEAIQIARSHGISAEDLYGDARPYDQERPSNAFDDNDEHGENEYYEDDKREYRETSSKQHMHSPQVSKSTPVPRQETIQPAKYHGAPSQKKAGGPPRGSGFH
jgi:hypothetical protein